MAGQLCGGEIYGCVTRFARLSATGTTPAGADGLIVTDQLVELVATDEVEAGTEINQPTACGAYAFPPYKAPDLVKWKSLALTLGSPDYELEEMMTDALLIVASGSTIGIAEPLLGLRAAGSGVSLELWSMALENGQQATVRPWIRTVFTKTVNWRKGPRRWFNGAWVPTFTGIALQNANWLNGPANDWTGPSDRVMATQRETTAPPTPVCGFQAIPAQV